MTIHIKRLDCTGYITAMIAIVQRHALLTDGAQQQALDEIAQGLHNIDAIIQRRRLAALLNSPVPPVPVRNEDDDDMDMDEEADIDDEDEDDKEPAAPPTAAATAAPTTEAQSLSPAVQRVADYIRAHPGCTVVEMRKALQISNGTLSTYIGHIRRAGLPVESEGRPAVYRMGGGA
ncbi:MAG: hypothetical protein WBO46_15850 [Caldilineaceae bacterium]